jgi:hypothetical protein
MYVSRGIGAAPRRGILPLPVFTRRRGMGADGSTAASCTTPNYWNGGLSRCCAPLGTPPGADPCSILNNPDFIAAQNTAVTADITTLGPDSAAAALAGVPINIGDAAVFCANHPGNNYNDPISRQVFACPAGGHQDLSGATWSNYTMQQLAAMLNAQYGAAAPRFAGNAPVTGFSPTPVTTGGANGGGLAITPTVRLVNSSGGSNSAFSVGDSWQIIVTGAPNSQVTASANQNGTSLGTSPMGTIGSNGSLTLTGTFGAGQVGTWSESWKVGGVTAGTLSFSVAAAGTGSSSDASGSSTSFLNNSVSVAGASIPTWALIAAGVGAVLFLGGRH